MNYKNIIYSSGNFKYLIELNNVILDFDRSIEHKIYSYRSSKEWELKDIKYNGEQ